MKKKYDLIFSIGEARSCAEVLRESRLRFYSYPFDWLYGSTLLDRIKMLANNMKDFINKEDLEFAHEARSISCNAYCNKLNNITFNHDFKNNIPFDEAYIEVREKYNKRINRLLEQIRNSQNILVVYIQTPNNKSEIAQDAILEGYDILKEKFGDKINLLYLFCEPEIDVKNRIEIDLNQNVKCIKYDYNAYNIDFPYVVNQEKLLAIFNKIRITNKFLTNTNRLEYFLYKIKLLFKGKPWKII